MSTRRAGWRGFAIVGAALACGTTAAQDAIVRASLSDDGTVWVGQRVVVVVELLAPGYFASAVSFDLPDPDGVLLMPPAGRPVVGSETVDGTRYTVQRHTLSAWPMRAGDQTIPALTARFTFNRNPLDDDEVPASVTAPPIAFGVELPPGAEGLGTVISARDLEVDETWRPEPGNADVAAGTAFTRIVTFTAPDVLGMVFPPFPAGDIDGLGVYAKPQVLDRTNRGALTGVRSDEITYVLERPGELTIPAVRFTWFDLDAMQLRTEELPARTFDVVANPAMAAGGAARMRIDRRSLGLAAGGLALVALAVAALRNAGFRRLAARGIAAFRPVRLEPLNPLPGGRGDR